MRERKNLDAQFTTCSSYLLLEVLDFVASNVDVAFIFRFLLSCPLQTLMLVWSVFITEFANSYPKQVN